MSLLGREPETDLTLQCETNGGVLAYLKTALEEGPDQYLVKECAWALGTVRSLVTLRSQLTQAIDTMDFQQIASTLDSLHQADGDLWAKERGMLLLSLAENYLPQSRSTAQLLVNHSGLICQFPQLHYRTKALLAKWGSGVAMDHFAQSKTGEHIVQKRSSIVSVCQKLRPQIKYASEAPTPEKCSHLTEGPGLLKSANIRDRLVALSDHAAAAVCETDLQKLLDRLEGDVNRQLKENSLVTVPLISKVFEWCQKSEPLAMLSEADIVNLFDHQCDEPTYDEIASNEADSIKLDSLNECEEGTYYKIPSISTDDEIIVPDITRDPSLHDSDQNSKETLETFSKECNDQFIQDEEKNSQRQIVPKMSVVSVDVGVGCDPTDFESQNCVKQCHNIGINTSDRESTISPPRQPVASEDEHLLSITPFLHDKLLSMEALAKVCSLHVAEKTSSMKNNKCRPITVQKEQRPRKFVRKKTLHFAKIPQLLSLDDRLEDINEGTLKDTLREKEAAFMDDSSRKKGARRASESRNSDRMVSAQKDEIYFVAGTYAEIQFDIRKQLDQNVATHSS